MLSIFIGLSSIPSFAQQNGEIKLNAEVISGCFLEADNINFGVLMMPLNDSVAQSKMKVKCSKGTNLNFTISYGNTISSGELKYVVYQTSVGEESGKLYFNNNPVSTEQRDIYCGRHITGKPFYVYNQSAADIIGYKGDIKQFVPDKLGLCSSTFSTVDPAKVSSLYQKTGVLNGLQSNESIVYYLEVPSSTTVWGSSNKYEILSTGTEQEISLKANIKRADNPSYRMTPDTYQSTLTILLTY